MPNEIRDPVSRVRQRFERRDGTLVVDNWLEPSGGLPAHFHPQQEERWSVVEGEVRFRLGDDERTITAEDGEIVVDPGVVHGLANDGKREAHLRCVVTPPLHLEEFLVEAADAGKEGLFDTKGRPRGLRGARWAAGFLKRYRDETVFVFPPQPVQRAMFALLARNV
jgi:quercetin dioxygenase-like cupin family protein